MRGAYVRARARGMLRLMRVGCKRCGVVDATVRVVVRSGRFLVWWLCGKCWRETEPEPEVDAVVVTKPRRKS